MKLFFSVWYDHFSLAFYKCKQPLIKNILAILHVSRWSTYFIYFHENSHDEEIEELLKLWNLNPSPQQFPSICSWNSRFYYVVLITFLSKNMIFSTHYELYICHWHKVLLENGDYILYFRFYPSWLHFLIISEYCHRK